jgi:CheY-like chemotaxis protein
VVSEESNHRTGLPWNGGATHTLVADPPRPQEILVVDDEPGIAEMLACMLSAEGYEVATAGNGAIALDRLRQGTYDLILSDVTMPELDGPGLYRALEQQHPHLCDRMIFLTADFRRPEVQAFLDRTHVRVLGKPFRLEELRQLVRQRLGALPRGASA